MPGLGAACSFLLSFDLLECVCVVFSINNSNVSASLFFSTETFLKETATVTMTPFSEGGGYTRASPNLRVKTLQAAVGWLTAQEHQGVTSQLALLDYFRCKRHFS